MLQGLPSRVYCNRKDGALESYNFGGAGTPLEAHHLSGSNQIPGKGSKVDRVRVLLRGAAEWPRARNTICLRRFWRSDHRNTRFGRALQIPEYFLHCMRNIYIRNTPVLLHSGIHSLYSTYSYSPYCRIQMGDPQTIRVQ